MTQQRRQTAFCVGPAWGVGQQHSQQLGPMVFRFSAYLQSARPPFAHMLGGDGRRSPGAPPPPPLARMASVPPPQGGGSNQAEEKFAHWLEAMAQRELERDRGEEAMAAAAAVDGKSKHDNTWYQERCAFCCACKRAIDAETGRRGMRCTGCRRWFHMRCNPRHTTGDSGVSSSGGAATTPGVDGNGRFFHSAECEEGHAALRREAARGRRPLTAPPDPTGPLAGVLSWLGFGSSGSRSSGSSVSEAEEPLTVRLIDLGAVKRDYRALQRSGTLQARRQRLLEDAGLAPLAPGAAERRRQQQQQSNVNDKGSGSSKDSEDGSEQERKTGGQQLRRWGAVDDFLLASEVMVRQWPSDQPKDLLEDSFGVLLARGATPLCVAQINLHAPDHARIQGIVTAQGHRRQGHAGTLLRELHGVLAAAGLGRVVAIIAEDNDESRVARDRLLKRQLGYRDLPIEELVDLRQELPDYNNTLVGGRTLLVRHLDPLPPKKSEAPPAATAEAGIGAADA